MHRPSYSTTDSDSDSDLHTKLRILHSKESNFTLSDSLYYAAANGDITKFQDYTNRLDQITTPNGNTILHIHITSRPKTTKNHHQMVNENDFITKVIDICPDLLSKVNKRGETLLHLAARHGHGDVARFIIDECRKPGRIRDQERGFVYPERLMLEKVNDVKDTALHESVRFGYVDVVKVLVREDSSLVYGVNDSGESPLYLAAERGYGKIVLRILKGCDEVVDHGPFCRTALHAAVIRNDTGITTLLLNDSRIQPSEQDLQGWTPLHFAAHFGLLEIAKRLITVDKSAAYKPDSEGKTALHIAASRGHANIMQFLITECPGCCELVDNNGRNVLHFASTSKNRKTVRLILQNRSLGNLVNAKDWEGNTPFLHAASMRLFLIHLKVDRLVFDNENRNAVDVVKPVAYFEPRKLLDLILWNFIKLGIKRCPRIISNQEQDLRENENQRESIREPNDLIVAMLIATVTFIAGTLLQDSEKSKTPAFGAFVVLNIMSMFLSSYAVITHFSTRPVNDRRKMRLRQGLVGCAMWTLVGAFVAATFVGLRGLEVIFVIGCVLSVFVVVFLRVVNRWIE